jgi:hypothetical protein
MLGVAVGVIDDVFEGVGVVDKDFEEVGVADALFEGVGVLDIVILGVGDREGDLLAVIEELCALAKFKKVAESHVVANSAKATTNQAPRSIAMREVDKNKQL